jgi:hypothetical protein
MTADMDTSIKASRTRVPRSRGAASGALLLILGAWAALVPFIGPYFDFAFTPSPNKAWHWTSARGWLEVLPGAAVVLGALLLLFSASRVVTVFGAWLAAAGGAWLIVGPPLASLLKIKLGAPDPTSSKGVRALESLLFFFGIGAVILFLASLALGRLSVHSVRDVRAAERRVAAEEEAAAEQRRADERRLAEERRQAEERRPADERNPDQVPVDDRRDAAVADPAARGNGNGDVDTSGRHEREAGATAATSRFEAPPGAPNQPGGPVYPGQPNYPDQQGQPVQPGQGYTAAPPPPEQQR